MKVTLIRYTPDADELGGIAAAECYQGANPKKSLDRAMKRGHLSVVEHASFTFRTSGVSRVLLAQITRHRIASFSVQSQRYCGAKVDVVIPESMKIPELENDIAEARHVIEDLYDKALRLGVPKEDARYITMQGGVTSFVFTMNGRELLHFFELRCCNRAQWEIRELAWSMLLQCKAVAPKLFEKAGPPCINGVCPEGASSCGKPYKHRITQSPLSFEEAHFIAEEDKPTGGIPIYIERREKPDLWILPTLLDLPEKDYNRTWRPWARKPSAYERNAVKWEELSFE